jgi:hypothetical protein
MDVNEHERLSFDNVNKTVGYGCSEKFIIQTKYDTI